LTFARKYNDEQRSAVEIAWGDRAIRPAARIVELARSGDLSDTHGRPVEAFELPESAVRTLGARYVRRRQQHEIELRRGTSPDALEQLRRRMLLALELELQRLERLQTRTVGRAPRVPIAEQLRQLARAARELAAVPTLEQPAPASGARPHSAGLAAAIVRANASGAPAALEPATGARVNGPLMAPVTEQQSSEQSSEDPSSDGAHAWRGPRINDASDARATDAPGCSAPAQLSASELRVREP
jgi:hypothetical protein